MNLTSEISIIAAGAAAPAGTTTVEGAVIDTANAEGVVFLTSIGTANAGNYLKVQQGALADGSDAADVAGTKLVATADGNRLAVELFQPTARYLRAVIVRGVSTATGDITALLHSGRHRPAAHGDTVQTAFHLSPAVGTP